MSLSYEDSMKLESDRRSMNKPDKNSVDRKVNKLKEDNLDEWNFPSRDLDSEEMQELFFQR